MQKHLDFPNDYSPRQKNNYSKFGNFTLCPSLLHFKGDRAKGNNSTSKHKETAWGWLRRKPSRFKSKPTSLGRHRKRRNLWTITPGLSKILQSAQKSNCFQRNRIQVWTIMTDEGLELNEMISYIFTIVHIIWIKFGYSGKKKCTSQLIRCLAPNWAGHCAKWCLQGQHSSWWGKIHGVAVYGIVAQPNDLPTGCKTPMKLYCCRVFLLPFFVISILIYTLQCAW